MRGNKLSLMELDSYIDDFANALIQIQTLIDEYLGYSFLQYISEYYLLE